MDEGRPVVRVLVASAGSVPRAERTNLLRSAPVVVVVHLAIMTLNLDAPRL